MNKGIFYNSILRLSLALILLLSSGVSYSQDTGTPDKLITKEDPGVLSEIDIEDITIPFESGSIISRYKGTRPLSIIHIHDAHCDYNAQKKIAELIKYFHDQYGLSLINIEGASGSYDLFPLTRIIDSRVRKKVSDRFLKTGVINGAEFTAVQTPENYTLWGIESPDYYVHCLQVYKESLGYNDEVNKLLDELETQLSSLSEKILPEEILRFNRIDQDYEHGNTDFENYLSFLEEMAEKHEIDLSGTPYMRIIVKIFTSQKNMDFKKINKESERLLKILIKNLSITEREELLACNLNFKKNEISKIDYYGFIYDKVKQLGLDLSSFPSLSAYFSLLPDYKKFYQDRTKITEEQRVLEKKIRDKLLTTKDQKIMDRLLQNIAILKKMFSLKMSVDDFNDYKANIDSFDMRFFRDFVDKQNTKYGLSPLFDVKFLKIDKYRNHIEPFYYLSLKRDDAFLKNMLIKMLYMNETTSIMLTGGFHSENIHKLLREKDISYISIIPSFKPAAHNPYFSLLSGGGSPVEQQVRSSLSFLMISSRLSRGLGKEIYGESGIDVFELSSMVMAAAESGESLTIRTADGKTVEFSPGQKDSEVEAKETDASETEIDAELIPGLGVQLKSEKARNLLKSEDLNLELTLEETENGLFKLDTACINRFVSFFLNYDEKLRKQAGAKWVSDKDALIGQTKQIKSILKKFRIKPMDKVFEERLPDVIQTLFYYAREDERMLPSIYRELGLQGEDIEILISIVEAGDLDIDAIGMGKRRLAYQIGLKKIGETKLLHRITAKVDRTPEEKNSKKEYDIYDQLKKYFTGTAADPVSKMYGYTETIYINEKSKISGVQFSEFVSGLTLEQFYQNAVQKKGPLTDSEKALSRAYMFSLGETIADFYGKSGYWLGDLLPKNVIGDLESDVRPRVRDIDYEMIYSTPSLKKEKDVLLFGKISTAEDQGVKTMNIILDFLKNTPFTQDLSKPEMANLILAGLVSSLAGSREGMENAVDSLKNEFKITLSEKQVSILKDIIKTFEQIDRQGESLRSSENREKINFLKEFLGSKNSRWERYSDWHPGMTLIASEGEKETVLENAGQDLQKLKPDAMEKIAKSANVSSSEAEKVKNFLSRLRFKGFSGFYLDRIEDVLPILFTLDPFSGEMAIFSVIKQFGINTADMPGDFTLTLFPSTRSKDLSFVTGTYSFGIQLNTSSLKAPVLINATRNIFDEAGSLNITRRNPETRNVELLTRIESAEALKERDAVTMEDAEEGLQKISSAKADEILNDIVMKDAFAGVIVSNEDYIALKTLFQNLRFSNIKGIHNNRLNDIIRSFVSFGDVRGKTSEKRMFNEILDQLGVSAEQLSGDIKIVISPELDPDAQDVTINKQLNVISYTFTVTGTGLAQPVRFVAKTDVYAEGGSLVKTENHVYKAISTELHNSVKGLNLSQEEISAEMPYSKTFGINTEAGNFPVLWSEYVSGETLADFTPDDISEERSAAFASGEMFANMFSKAKTFPGIDMSQTAVIDRSSAGRIRVKNIHYANVDTNIGELLKVAFKKKLGLSQTIMSIGPMENRFNPFAVQKLWNDPKTAEKLSSAELANIMLAALYSKLLQTSASEKEALSIIEKVFKIKLTAEHVKTLDSIRQEFENIDSGKNDLSSLLGEKPHWSNYSSWATGVETTPVPAPESAPVTEILTDEAAKKIITEQVESGKKLLSKMRFGGEKRIFFVPVTDVTEQSALFSTGKKTERDMNKKYGIDIELFYYDGTAEGLAEAYKEAGEFLKKPKALSFAYVPQGQWDAADKILGKDPNARWMEYTIPEGQVINEVMSIVLGVGLMDFVRHGSPEDYDASLIWNVITSMADVPGDAASLAQWDKARKNLDQIFKKGFLLPLKRINISRELGNWKNSQMAILRSL